MQRTVPGKWLWLTLMIVVITGCAPQQSGVARLGGLLWGQYREQIQLSREQAVAKHNYCPTGGCVVRLEAVQVQPRQARPGDTVTLTASYTILTPEQVAIPVSITRRVEYQGKSVGEVKVIETRNRNGTWANQAEFHLPAEAPSGSYTVDTRVSTGYGMAQKSAAFWVE